MVRTALCFLLFFCSGILFAKDVCRIGVLAHRGKPYCQEKWDHLADYLNNRIPAAEFVIIPLDFKEIYEALQQKKIEFLLANPATIAIAESMYNIRPIASVSRLAEDGKTYDYFGSVIFCRKNDDTINSFADLKDKVFMAVNPDSFGGWLVPKYTMMNAGFNPEKKFKSLEFGNTHDAVVMRVKNGTVDAGCVRTGILEDMASAGTININDFKIINKQKYADSILAFSCSTQLFPEWGFIGINDNKFGKDILMAMMEMPHSLSEKIGSWTIPNSYFQVTECLKSLKYGPYSNEANSGSIMTFWQENKEMSLGMACLFFIMLCIIIYLVQSRRFREKYVKHMAENMNELQLKTRQLNESEDQFRLLFENAISAIAMYQIIFNTNGVAVDFIFLRVNHAFEQLTGKNKIDLIGRKASEIYNGDKVASWLKAYGAVVKTSIPQCFVHYYEEQDKWVQVHAYKTGALNFCVLYQDITEQREQEERLRLSHEQFRLAVDGSNDGIWDYDLRTNSFYISSRWKEMIGYEDDELLNDFSTFEEHLHPDDKNRVMDYLNRYLIGGFKSFCIEFRFRHKNGTYVWIQSRAQAIYSEEGSPCRIAGSHSNVTARKQMEDELNAIYENIPMVAVLVDSDLRIQKANRISETYMGDADCFIGKRIGEALRCVNHTSESCELSRHCRNCPIQNAANDTLKNGVNHCQLEVPIVAYDALGDRQVNYTMLMSSILIHINDAPMALICLLDITSRKNVENKLNNALSHLRSLNRKLREKTQLARDMFERAKEADNAKSEFMSCMSHEIRTPLNGIIGMSGLLADTPLYGPQQQYVRMLQASGETLLTLINDILDFSKLEARKIDIEHVDFNLYEAVDKTVEILYFKAIEKGLELNCLIDPTIPHQLNGDIFKIQQIINNLIGNAIKFTENGEVFVEISGTRNTDARQIGLRIRVSDTGIGMTDAHKERLFIPFSQGDASISRKFGGSGLGLAICKQLAELMGGNITCESISGKGSVFQAEVIVDRTENERDYIHDRMFRDLRSLVISSKTAVNRIISSYLTHVGGHVVCVDEHFLLSDYSVILGDGGMPYDLVIIDSDLLGNERTEIIRKIKDDLNFTRAAIVELLDQHNVVKADMTLLDGYIIKPLKSHQLMENILAIMTGGFWKEHDSRIMPETGRQVLKNRFDNVRVLLAEDNETNQAVARGILAKFGFIIDVADNGEEAIKLTEMVNYELIVMDCQMPKVDGFQATRHIRALEHRRGKKHVPIIAMTASALKGDRERCIDAGMDDYIAKPVDPGKLEEKLCIWLHDRNTVLKSDESELVNMEDVFCEVEFLNRLMGDRNLAQTVLEGFLKDIPVKIAAVEDLLGADDMLAARQLAHSIKGAAANIGAKRLRSAAEMLEHMLRDGNFSEAINTVLCLENEFDSLKNELAKLKQGVLS